MIGRDLVRSVVLILLLFGAGCDSVPEELQPDPELRRTLGLTEKDVVYEVGLRGDPDGEFADPSEVLVERSGRVGFRSLDPRARRVVIDTVDLDPNQRAFVRPLLPGSPPLIHTDAWWLMDLREAPVGAYGFRVSGGTGESSVRVVIPPVD